MKKTSNHFVVVSFVVMILVCIAIISFYTMSMAKKSNDTMNSIGAIYMDGMNTEITRHFQTTIDLRLNQVNVIVENNDPADFESEEKMLNTLASEGKLRNFKYLAFVSSTGNIQMIYGNQIEIKQIDWFVDALNNNNNRVALAVDASGDETVVLGISAVYPMKGNEKCTALVAGVSMEDLKKILAGNDANDSITFTSIIQKNGDYIVKNDNEQSNNYFSRIRSLYADYEQKNAEDYIGEIQEAMSRDESYSSIFILEKERRHLFCSPLKNTEWYLITVMPYGELDEAIENLSAQRTEMMLICLLVILVMCIAIFSVYYVKTRRQLRELELAREKAVKASKAKSDFLSNMSHDIRTPMNAIVGMTAVASSNIDNKPQLQNCLKKISQSNKQLLGLINDILDMSKIENGKMIIKREQVSLPELVSDIVTVIQPQIREKRQDFDVQADNIIAENVYSDGVRLTQVIMNILSNAIKFTPDSGIIHMSLRQESSALGDGYVRVIFKIKDNGIGMSDEFKNKIFDSFAREDNKRVNKTEGTGLGMAITKYIIDAMKGTIEVDSQQGEGTEFRVIIDMEKASAEAGKAEMTFSGWNILIANDDGNLYGTVSRLLGELGINVDVSLDCESALEMMSKKRAAGEDYNAVIMEWGMSDTDCVEATRRIHDNTDPKIPIIIISAYDWSEKLDEAVEAGVSGFIQKPLFRSTLYSSLKAIAEKSEGTDIINSTHHKNYSGIKILVAEDNDINWEIINELLSQLGFEMEHAENGKECLDKFSASEPGSYSAIFMDIRMPIMDGYETTTAIRRLERADAETIPIIAMTANAFSDDIKSCIECGMNAHIAKPIELQEVLRQLEKHLNL